MLLLFSIEKILPTVNITSAIQIYHSISNTNRTYYLPISITGTTNAIVTITNNNNTVLQNYSFNNQYITIPMPTTSNNYVEVL